MSTNYSYDPYSYYDYRLGDGIREDMEYDRLHPQLQKDDPDDGGVTPEEAAKYTVWLEKCLGLAKAKK